MSTYIFATAFCFSYLEEVLIIDRLIGNAESSGDVSPEEASVLAAYDKQLNSLLERTQKTSCLLAKASLI